MMEKAYIDYAFKHQMRIPQGERLGTLLYVPGRT
jgi:hypothetical protein